MCNFNKNIRSSLLLLLCLICAVLNMSHAVTRTLTSLNNSIYANDIMSLAKAADVRNVMNPKVNPCDDFYEFACGNWAKIHPASSEKYLRTSVFTEMEHAYERKILQILKLPTASDEELVERKLKDFYASCMTAIDDDGAAADDGGVGGIDKIKFRDVIAEFGVMPLLAGNAWNAQDFDWLETLALMKRSYGVQLLIGLDVNRDFKRGNRNRVYVGQPYLKLQNKSFYLDEIGLNYRLAYRDEVARKLEKYLSIDAELALQTAEEIVGFEILLARGMLPYDSVVKLEELAVNVTVEELQAKYAPAIDFERLFNITLGEIPEGYVYVYLKNYLINLKDVLLTTNRRLLANYMFYQLLNEFLPAAISTPAAQQQTICLSKVKKYFAKYLDNIIYQKYNFKAVENVLKNIWTLLREQFNLALYTPPLAWLTPTTREYALEKLNYLHLSINAYMQRNFTAEYDDLNITSKDFIGNLKRIYHWHAKRHFDSLNQAAARFEDFELNALTPVNILWLNTIRLPVLLLQPHYLWGHNYPNALLFSTLGFLLGHELMHSFDDKGRLYNKQGELANWWDESTTNAFMEKRTCFAAQYHRYVYHNKQLPQLDLQTENIADNAGLKLAYNAYRNWHRRVLAEIPDHTESLPNLKYNDEQLFFISYAQLLCSDVDRTLQELDLALDQHTPNKFRVIGTLSNLDGFATAFDCPSGSVMNPVEKCELY